MLAWHVDYWDRLGWKDTFSSKRWTQRQRDYAKVLRMKRIGTPFFYVANQRKTKGVIQATVDRESRYAPRVKIELDVKTESGKAKVSAKLGSDWPVRKEAHVFAVLFRKRVSTKITSGENGGITAQEFFAVIDASKPAAYGDTYTHEFTLPKDAKDMGVALLVENPKTMKTLACAKADIR